MSLTHFGSFEKSQGTSGGGLHNSAMQTSHILLKNMLKTSPDLRSSTKSIMVDNNEKETQAVFSNPRLTEDLKSIAEKDASADHTSKTDVSPPQESLREEASIEKTNAANETNDAAMESIERPPRNKCDFKHKSLPENMSPRAIKNSEDLETKT